MAPCGVSKKGASLRFSRRVIIGNNGVPRVRIGWPSVFFPALLFGKSIPHADEPQPKRGEGGWRQMPRAEAADLTDPTDPTLPCGPVNLALAFSAPFCRDLAISGNRSVENPRVFIPLGGPKAHGHSLTVAAHGWLLRFLLRLACMVERPLSAPFCRPQPAP